MSIKKAAELLLNLLQFLLFVALALNIREEQLVDFLPYAIQRFPHTFQPLPLELFMGGLILD